MQSSRNAELKLLIGLRGSTALKYFDCGFDRGLVGGITLTMVDQSLGCWWYDNEHYCFSSVAYRPGPIKVKTVHEVCEETQKIVTSKMVRDTADRKARERS